MLDSMMTEGNIDDDNNNAVIAILLRIELKEFIFDAFMQLS
jgi:hypothetical protein